MHFDNTVDLKNTLKKTLLISFIFGLFGVTVEVFFTAFSPLFSQDTFSWSLQGNSYAWMFIIYALTKPLFDLGYPFVSKFNILIRTLSYSLVVFLIEFISGLVLEKLTGSCPWKYVDGLTFLGYIRLDYIFYWMVFGYFIEYIYLFLQKIIRFDEC